MLLTAHALSMDREDRLCVLQAESKQGRHDALFLLPPPVLCQQTCSKMPKLATRFRKTPSVNECSEGRYDRHFSDKSPCPDRMENSRLGRTG